MFNLKCVNKLAKQNRCAVKMEELICVCVRYASLFVYFCEVLGEATLNFEIGMPNGSSQMMAKIITIFNERSIERERPRAS